MPSTRIPSHAARADVERGGCGERREHGQHCGRTQQLGGGEHDAALGPACDVAPGVGKADAVADRCAGAGEMADRLATAKATPGPEQEHDPREPEREADRACAAVELLVAEREQDEREHPQRRACVPQTGHDR